MKNLMDFAFYKLTRLAINQGDKHAPGSHAIVVIAVLFVMNLVLIRNAVYLVFDMLIEIGKIQGLIIYVLLLLMLFAYFNHRRKEIIMERFDLLVDKSMMNKKYYAYTALSIIFLFSSEVLIRDIKPIPGSLPTQEQIQQEVEMQRKIDSVVEEARKKVYGPAEK